MGGFYGGMVAGAVSVLAIGAVVSLNTPLSTKPEVASTAPESLDNPSPTDADDLNVIGKDADLVARPPQEPTEPQAAVQAGLDEVEERPGTLPDTGSAPSVVEAPAAPESPSVTVEADAPAAQSDPASVAVVPQQEAEPDLTAETVQPPAPKPPETPEPAPQVAEAPEPQADEVPEPAPQAAPVPDDTETEAPRIAGLQPEPQAPEIEEEVSIQDNPIAVEGDEDTLPRNQPRIFSVPEAPSDQSSSSGTLVGKRVVPLTERNNPPAEEVDTQSTGSGKPIQDYAAEFDNPDDKPLMSIILIDDEGAFGAEALADFPYPISFAVSPTDPQAAEKMARHREAGFEVLALVDMHQAASAQDAEVSLSVWLETLHEAVGILEGVGTGIQGNRKLADQVAAIAGDTGRGLVTQDSGLNTVQKLAARNGVPSGVVFRDFDGARQDATVMRRFLDQAAFRAGQEGAVVMMGRLRPETISALLLWGLEDRGSRVAMAPISAVMMREIQKDGSALEY